MSERMTEEQLADLTDYGAAAYRDLATAYDLADTVLPPMIAAVYRDTWGERLGQDWRQFGNIDSFIVNQHVAMAQDLIAFAAGQGGTSGAVEHACDLADGSVVADDRRAYIKNRPSKTAPWRGTDGGYHGDWSVDADLATGAQILRRGAS